MRTVLLVAIIVLCSVRGYSEDKQAKKLRKEQEKAVMARPLEVNIKGNPEKIKALIIRAMINQGFDPDKDSERQLTFMGEARGSAAKGYQLGRMLAGSEVEQMLEEIRFSLFPEGGTITVTAQAYWVSVSHGGATTRTRDNSKDVHLLVLWVLDQAKAEAEKETLESKTLTP